MKNPVKKWRVSKRTQTLLWLLCFAHLPSPAFGRDQKGCHPGDPSRCVVQIKKGDPAPFAGVLQTPKQAAIVAVRAAPEYLERKVAAEVDLVAKLAEADLALEKKYRAVDKDAYEKKITALHRSYGAQIDLLQKQVPQWYEEPWFVATVVIIAGSVIYIGIRATNPVNNITL